MAFEPYWRFLGGRRAERCSGALALLDVAGVAPGVPRALAGRYRLVRPLAKGGMAEVWEGRDEVLSRPVAVKMLLAHLAADPHLRERFRREAVTAARLVHPGIVATFDAGVTPLGEAGAGTGSLLSGGWSRDESESLELAWPAPTSTAFIVMELVPGETLRDLMARACPLPPDLAVALIAQVTDALAYAHAQGLVHRDIKPANVLLRDEGGGMVRVKVADFGIAKAAAAAGGDLTASGTVLGTPKYLAPEQVQGHEPDARADLYSLGVVLFEMLAGAPPFKAPLTWPRRWPTSSSPPLIWTSSGRACRQGWGSGGRTAGKGARQAGPVGSGPGRCPHGHQQEPGYAGPE